MLSDLTTNQETPVPDAIPPDVPAPTDMPSVAPEASRDAVTSVPVEDQNGSEKQENSQIPELPKDSAQSAPAPLTSVTAQTQSLAQQDQTGFIRALLAKANAKLHSNRQKKLDNLMLMAQKKHIITNDDVQKLLRVSDATATRYLVKLVQQGRLARVGSPRDAKYQFVR